MNQTADFRTLDDWLPWLESLSPREIVLGLERVHEVLARLDITRPELVIIVTGTNGKGSSAAMLEALLRHAGRRTGCYTSPHLVRYNERIRIEGVAADDHTVMDALQVVEDRRSDVPLTFFEFGTLAALIAFDRAKLDAWILEVGMGGRLDAVNAIDPDASLITNVALDHRAWLGDDVESIAREKAGIMRPGKPVVFGSTRMPAAIETHARKIGAGLIALGRDFFFEDQGATWSWRGRRLQVVDLARPRLTGARQLENASAVLALLESLGQDDWLDRDHIDAAWRAIELPGRFQVVGDRWILDVAHNEAAGEVMDAQLREIGIKRLIAVVGMLADKDAEGFLATFGDSVDEWIAVPIEGNRGQSALATAMKIANCRQKPCLVADSLAEALQAADARAGQDDRILVTGSFHVVGPALDWLGIV